MTLAVGRLQHLLAIFNDTLELPALDGKRHVLMTTMADETHSFGAQMVEKFLSAGGWTVQSEPAAAADAIAELVEHRWFAVAGLTVSCDRDLSGLADLIGSIRKRSCNRAIGIMVGGPVFIANPGLAVELGADATASNAPAAVVLAQKLFDKGAKSGWQE
ncbi:B12-binding domain-containing protein [uncultured Methylobacterium sp.]|uniref:cobalamin B12-binding domain-containing protein n=1 Tax=uncultured Methylobacterium sp. TaxID=157278 RepID=UPI0035CAA398